MTRNVGSLRGEWGDAAPGNAVDESVVDAVGGTVFSELLMASAAECILVVDESMRVVFANPGVERVFGYDPEEIVDGDLSALIPVRLREAHRRGFEAYLRRGERTVDWDGARLRGLRRDGEEVPLAMWFREFAHGGDRYFVGVARDVSTRVEQRERLESERAFLGSVFEAVPDVLYAFDRDGRMLRWNDRVNEVTGYDDAEIESLEPLEFVAERDHEEVAAAIGRVLSEGAVETVDSALVTSDETEIPYEFTGAPIVESGEIVGVTGVGRDVSERRRHERTLERLDDLNTAIRSVDRALVEATTREEIAEAVCTGLVDGGAYCGTVIGSRGADGGALDADAWAGRGRAMIAADGGEFEDAARATVTRALETESVRVTDGLSSDRRGSAGDGARYEETVAAVPLIADEQSFGVLGVCTGREHGISGRERAVLEELGETIGNAIQSALTRQLLHSDAVTEIELRTTDGDVPFVAVSEAAECRLELERAVSFGDESAFYFAIEDASAERVREVAASVDSLDAVQTLDDGRAEFRTCGETITGRLSQLGARTTAGVSDHGEGRIVAELPADAMVREVIDAVRDDYPETELFARHESDRSRGRRGSSVAGSRPI